MLENDAYILMKVRLFGQYRVASGLQHFGALAGIFYTHAQKQKEGISFGTKGKDFVKRDVKQSDGKPLQKRNGS